MVDMLPGAACVKMVLSLEIHHAVYVGEHVDLFESMIVDHDRLLCYGVFSKPTPSQRARGGPHLEFNSPSGITQVTPSRQRIGLLRARTLSIEMMETLSYFLFIISECVI